ncbi:hypothetical protein E2C01_004474 [Portunus trituberculatus]|uniref:Uncharacterized protein n=1 Tax=Portunus trituberculatus TaxID=210409 RepID=A0A5B7CQM0_PORTR|nr:hypothetical protein [Portunus trituberculatus]
MSVSACLVPLLTKEEHLLWAERVKPHLPHCISCCELLHITVIRLSLYRLWASTQSHSRCRLD